MMFGASGTDTLYLFAKLSRQLRKNAKKTIRESLNKHALHVKNRLEGQLNHCDKSTCDYRATCLNHTKNHKEPMSWKDSGLFWYHSIIPNRKLRSLWYNRQTNPLEPKPSSTTDFTLEPKQASEENHDVKHAENNAPNHQNHREYLYPELKEEIRKVYAKQLTALSLQRIHNIERRHSLALRVLRIRDGITDDTLKESLQNTTRLFVNH